MEKENRFHKNHPKINPNDPAMLLTAGIQEPKEEEVKQAPPVEKEEKPVNPLAGKIKKKEEGKSYGFYLSNEAIVKLEKLAKQNKCSKSKALDLLLRNIL
jgi:hypothetical protein